MKWTLFLITIFFIVTHAVSTKASEELQPGAILLKGRDSDLIEQIIRASLNNPESARFGPIGAIEFQVKGAYKVCGSFNTKSGTGKYAGNQKFIGLLFHQTSTSDFRLSRLSQPGLEDPAVAKMCSDIMN